MVCERLLLHCFCSGSLTLLLFSSAAVIDAKESPHTHSRDTVVPTPVTHTHTLIYSVLRVVLPYLAPRVAHF